MQSVPQDNGSKILSWKEMGPYLHKLVKEQRIEQLQYGITTQKPKLLDNDKLVKDFHQRFPMVEKAKIVRYLNSHNKYKHTNFDAWKGDLLKESAERKLTPSSNLPMFTADGRVSWTPTLLFILQNLMKEQRIQQLADSTILVHPANFNVVKLLEDINSKIENPITKQQLQKRLVNEKYNEKYYEEWKDEILLEIENREQEKPIEAFEKPDKRYKTKFKLWSTTETNKGMQIMKEYKNELQRTIVEKIFVALEGTRSNAAIRVHILFDKILIS